MKKTKTFKFLIEQPLKEAARDVKIQYLHIVAAFPQIAFRIELYQGQDMSEQEQIRLAVAELKVNLIQEIANAEFEMNIP